MHETIQRAQAGDATAFRALYDAHAGRVYALCLRLAGDRQQAEEHVQDVFVRAWERLESFRGESAFSTWLHRLAVNEVLQARRAAGRRALLPMPVSVRACRTRSAALLATRSVLNWPTTRHRQARRRSELLRRQAMCFKA